MTPTLPLLSGKARRYWMAPATSPMHWASGTPPAARAAAAASAALAPGAKRWNKLGHRAAYRYTAKVRVISLVALS